jgi:hypothetical protein
MTADNNFTEDKPDPTPFKVYPMTNEARSKRMRGLLAARMRLDVVPRLQKCKTRRGEPTGRVKPAQDLARRFADPQRGH